MSEDGRKQFQQVQTMRQQSLGELTVDVDPAQSDFEFGQAEWHLNEGSGVTRLWFEARIRPAFWVPPLIGPWAIRHVLREEARSTCNGLEQLARNRLP